MVFLSTTYFDPIGPYGSSLVALLEPDADILEFVKDNIYLRGYVNYRTVFPGTSHIRRVIRIIHERYVKL